MRGHPGLNRGPLDLQSNALPLSYIPNTAVSVINVVLIYFITSHANQWENISWLPQETMKWKSA